MPDAENHDQQELPPESPGPARGPAPGSPESGTPAPASHGTPAPDPQKAESATRSAAAEAEALPPYQGFEAAEIPAVEEEPDRMRLRRVNLRGRESPTHPWIFRRQLQDDRSRTRDRRVQTSGGGLSQGEAVELRDAGGDPVGWGFYHGDSAIAVRLMERGPPPISMEDFLRRALSRALNLRREILKLERQTNAYRLVHSEGDGLSGLIIDRYDDLLVCELFSRAFYERREVLEQVLCELIPGATVIFTVPPNAARREVMPQLEAEEVVERQIKERKVRFLVRPSGHKTGFFLDQRENRGLFASLVKGKKALDAFCYTGAFALAARTLGKAREVVAVDLDERAIEWGQRNAELNRAQIEFRHEDVFPYLRRQRHAVDRFEAISVDPPKWAADRHEVEAGAIKYIDVNALAMQALAPGGILMSSSCSGPVSEERFLGFIRAAADRAQRRVQILEVRGASPDHPVDIHCPESRYLKCVVARVE